MKAPSQSRATRPQVTLSDSVYDYLELKSELTGRPVATLIADLAFEAMRSELEELQKLKNALKNVQK
jgi:predicted DNA-binding protein